MNGGLTMEMALYIAVLYIIAALLGFIAYTLDHHLRNLVKLAKIAALRMEQRYQDEHRKFSPYSPPPEETN